jgi:1-acyl-sn-glycerol-3-phosphate acyltransferase
MNSTEETQKSAAAKREIAPTNPSPAYRVAYPYARVMLRVLARLLAPRLVVSGTRNVPRRGGCLVTPNHLADCDPPFLLNASPRPLWFMAKSELFDIPVLGPAMRFSQAFPVERGEPDRAALRRTEELLKAQQAVVVFPEGELSRSGEMQKMLPGAALLALRAGVPIVPVGICGTNFVMPYGKLIPRITLRRVHIHFGKPIDLMQLCELPKREQRDAAAKMMEAGIRRARAIAFGAFED